MLQCVAVIRTCHPYLAYTTPEEDNHFRGEVFLPESRTSGSAAAQAPQPAALQPKTKKKKGGISVICHVTHVQKMYASIYTHMYLRTHTSACCICTYGVATISRTLEIVGLFCNRALQKRLYPAKETYNFKEPTNRSHPMYFLRIKGSGGVVLGVCG